MNNRPRILLAMSGGIDSTAAALLLQEQGYDLVGCTFRTRYTDEASLQSAAALARQLGIEHHVVDYEQRFEQDIVAYFCNEYAAGRTPNPCVLCNRQIKFGVLLEEASRLGCDSLATGHYARVKEGILYRAKDERKDQTYFLWQVPQQALQRVLFPLGDQTKDEVRAFLESKGLTELAHKGESQDICFIKDDYRTFLQAQDASPLLPAEQGDYINAEGKVLGRHEGYVNYTIGQRKGLGIALGTPAFVTRIDAAHNRVTLGAHDDLYTHDVYLSHCVFHGDTSQTVLAQIRYRSKAQEAVLVNIDNNGVGLIRFAEPVWAVTPGQSCVMYQDNKVVGGGIIES